MEVRDGMKNEEQDTNNECGYEQQENDHASQSNGCNTGYGSFLNPDVLENIIETTVGRYPQMRQTLRAVLQPVSKDCVTHLSRKHVSFLIDLSIVYRLSSTVYRLSSIVYPLGFSTCLGFAL